MSDGKPDRNSIRPHGHSSECSGQGVEVESKLQAETTQEKAVLSLEGDATVKAEVDSDEIETIDEKEEAEVPLCLPAQYQLSHPEFLGHCVTHYPFRAWCPHCLEGRGRKNGVWESEWHKGSPHVSCCVI